MEIDEPSHRLYFCIHIVSIPASSTVCPKKKYPYNNRIISIEGTFFGTHRNLV
jgi:hypothetical protein